MSKKIVSVIVPCFNEEENIYNAYTAINQTIKKSATYKYEIIFVDNGSTDNTRKIIKSIASKDKSVSGICLSRNFGPDISAEVALHHTKADAAVIIHCDLQDPPSLIPRLLDKWEQGNNIVIGVYTKTEDIFVIGVLRRIFYKIFKSISNIDVPVNAGAFGLMDRKALNALKVLPERYRFFRGLRAWIGFRIAYITYERKKRLHGSSSYNLYSYFKHAERSFFGFSYLPLDIIIYLGLLLVTLSFIFIIVYLLLFLLFGNPVKGAVTIVVSIIFFGGIQLLALSVLGKYIEVIVEETKRRPLYIVDEIINERNLSQKK